LREDPAAIDHRRARGRERAKKSVAELSLAIAAIDGRRDRRPAFLVAVELHVGTDAAVVGVARQIARRDDVGAEIVAVGVEEQSPQVILRDAPLPGAGRHVGDPFAKAVVLVALVVVDAVDPVVQAIHQAIGLVLGLAAIAVVGGDHGLLIGFSIVIGIATEKEFRRRCDQHAIARQSNRAREHEPVEEDGGLIHLPVAVGVFQDRDPSARLAFAAAGDALHVPAHLADPEPAVGVEGDGDGVLHHRLFRDQIDMKTFGQLERADLLLTREKGDGFIG
jgi:hypothetical protein